MTKKLGLIAAAAATAAGALSLPTPQVASADGDPPLEGTFWSLETLLSGDVAWSVPVGVRTPTLTIDDGRLGLFAGCNSGAGNAEVGEDAVIIDQLILTVMVCDSPAMGVEEHVVSVLDGTFSYEIDGDALTLLDGANGLVFLAD